MSSMEKLSKSQRKNRNRRIRNQTLNQLIDSQAEAANNSNSNSQISIHSGLIPVKWENNINFLKLALLLCTNSLNLKGREELKLCINKIEIVRNPAALRQELLETGEEWMKELIRRNPNIDPNMLIQKIDLTIPHDAVFNSQCNLCGKALTSSIDYYCLECGWVYYCSAECQIKDCSNDINITISTLLEQYNEQAVLPEVIKYSTPGLHRVFCKHIQQWSNSLWKSLVEIDNKEIEPGNAQNYLNLKTINNQMIQHMYLYNVTEISRDELINICDNNIRMPPDSILSRCTSSNPNLLEFVLTEYFQLVALMDWLSLNYSPGVLILYHTNKSNSKSSVIMKSFGSPMEICEKCLKSFSKENPVSHCEFCTCSTTCQSCFTKDRSIHKTTCSLQYKRLEIILPKVFHKHVSFKIWKQAISKHGKDALRLGNLPKAPGGL